MKDTPNIVAARIEVEKRRAAMLDTVHVLQERLAPRTLASEAWEKAKNKGADLAEEAVDAVASRPVAVGGVAAAIAMFLAREPIKDAAVKFYDAMTSRDATKKPPAALTEKKKAPARPAKPRARPAAKPARRATRKTEKLS